MLLAPAPTAPNGDAAVHRRELSGVDFPADKDRLVEQARHGGADEETVRALRAVPPESYGGFGQVLVSVPLADDGGPTTTR